MKYGYFDNGKMEYVITNPKTPVKWVNFIGGLDFGGFVDQTGGATICKGDPALNRMTKYIPQMPDSDFKGESLYVRFKTGGEYVVFSPFYVPTLLPYDRYECRVGNGYNIITSEFFGIQTEVTIFIPHDSGREIRDIKITNLTDSTMEIDIVPVIEYSHFEAIKQFNNADWVPQTMQSEVVNEAGGLRTIKQYAFMLKGRRENYFTSNHPISSFETDRKRFLGDNGYGTFANPLSLYEDELSNYEALRGDNIVAALHHLGEVAPGQTKRIITQFSQFGDVEKDMKDIARFRDEAAVDAAFKALEVHWKKYFSKLQVETPLEDMNTLVNIHNPKQCMTTKHWSRFLSLYQLGLDGARGIGYRDTSQDLLGIMGLCADETLDMMKKLMSTQKRNGSAMHQFFPSSMVATIGEAGEKGRPDFYGDDHLWIILTVCEYIKETGDFAFLDEIVPFYEKEGGKPIESGTVLEHLNRAIEFTYNNKGTHGWPLLGYADWNDTVNLPKGAESNFNANLYGKGLLELMDLMKFMGKETDRSRYEKYYNEMKKSFNEHGWDGEWFIRYFDHEGKPVGSHVNEQGKIFTNGQSWSVLSGFASEEQGKIALDSVERLLNTRNGIKLSAPGYNGFDEVKGGVSTYPPGAKENGGIFLHANPWVMIAETILGNGERALKYYQQINPISKNDMIDEFEAEPYVYPQNILGDEHPQFGLGRNSWLSGTASWAYQASTKFILGVRAHYDCLVIDPCIPKDWKSYNMKRVFRDATYNISIKNPNSVNKGVYKLLVNGKEIHSNKCPLCAPGSINTVEVTLGER